MFKSLPQDGAEPAQFSADEEIRMESDFLMVISAAWGVYFLVAALLRLMMSTGNGPKGLLILLSYLLLIPMVIFTDKFQKWYPERLMRTR